MPRTGPCFASSRHNRMIETFENFIDGRWRASRCGATFEDENPACRGSSLGRFQSSTAEDVVDAVSAAAEAFDAWRRKPISERQQYVAEFLRLLTGSRDELARIVTLENGKTIRESRAEVDSALVEGSYHLQQAAKFFTKGSVRRQADQHELKPDTTYSWVRLEPIGVAGIISPWNFPMNVMCRKTLPALL